MHVSEIKGAVDKLQATIAAVTAEAGGMQQLNPADITIANQIKSAFNEALQVMAEFISSQIDSLPTELEIDWLWLAFNTLKWSRDWILYSDQEYRHGDLQCRLEALKYLQSSKQLVDQIVLNCASAAGITTELPSKRRRRRKQSAKMRAGKRSAGNKPG